MELPLSAAQRWRHVRDLDPSGQSNVCIVERLSDGTLGVLKAPSARPVQSDRLVREIQIIQSIVHPAVVRLLDSDLDGDPIWFVTPLGTPLPDWLTRRANSPSERAAEARGIVTALVDGLAAVHQRGIIHRDIKPPNIVMFDDRPVLIDFGIAFLPDAERLTEIDGRPVGNDHAPPAAHYGLIDHPNPWWDCLCLSWLWAWMLTDGPPPKNHRFHWKYHRMIAAPDADGVRALLAVCSDEQTAPRDVIGFGRLARDLGILPREQPSSSSGGPDFSQAAEVHARQLQRTLIASQSRRERTEAAALVLAPLYERVRAQLRAVVDQARAVNLPVRRDDYINDHPIAVCLSTLKEQRDSVELFACTFEPAGMERVRVVLRCEYSERLPTCWPFHFTLTRRPGPRLTGNDVMHLTDGQPLADWGRQNVNETFFPALLAQWLAEPTHWTYSAL